MQNLINEIKELTNNIDLSKPRHCEKLKRLRYSLDNKMNRIKRLDNKVFELLDQEEAGNDLANCLVRTDELFELIAAIEDLRVLFARTFSGNVWLLDELLVILKNELEAKERLVNPGEKHFERGEFSRYNSTSSFFHTCSEFIISNYLFCSGNNHNSNRCAKVTDPSARKQIIFQKKSLLSLYEPEI